LAIWRVRRYIERASSKDKFQKEREDKITCVSPKMSFQFCPRGKRFRTKAALKGLVGHMMLVPVIPQIGMM